MTGHGGFLAFFKDPSGIPRAWGMSESAVDAQAIAQIELDAYRDDKRKSGDYYMADARYTLELRQMQAGTAGSVVGDSPSGGASH